MRLARRIQRDVQARGRDVSSVIEQYTKFVKPCFDKVGDGGTLVLAALLDRQQALTHLNYFMHHDPCHWSVLYISCGVPSAVVLPVGNQPQHHLILNGHSVT